MGGYFSSLNAGTRQIAHEIECDVDGDPERTVQSVLDYPGLDKFQWKVWWVAASGFFTTSYSIFAVNVISPSLSYVYPECAHGSTTNSLVINLTTLAGTMVGMLLFGSLADRYGRKAIYGLELSIVVVSTVGMTTASDGFTTGTYESGYRTSMNVYGWIGFWRALLGIGLGAEYPLSAIIAAEWSSTKSRGKMIAAVFLMQSIGQLAAYGFGLAVLKGINDRFGLSPDETNPVTTRQAIDVVWRTTIGIGAFPALVALILRRIIPETPHYLVEKGELVSAVAAVGHVIPVNATLQTTSPYDPMVHHRPSDEPTVNPENRRSGWESTLEYLRGIKEHLAERQRWRALLGVMITWYILDLAYYGLGLDNPQTISMIWLSEQTNATATDVSTDLRCDNNTWRADPAWPDSTIYEMLQQDSIRNMITISSGALPGSIIALLAIDYLPRTTWMGWMFVTLAALFAVNGGTFFITFESDKHALTITLYVLAQLIFNIGPNLMTFMLPAELFATKYRGTFYGLAAASGKLGAITILLITKFRVYDRDIQVYHRNFAGLLLGFCPAMLLGAFITWVWVPEVQYPRGHDDKPERDDNASDDGLEDATFRQKLKLPNRPLADIAQNPGEGQILGMRRNIARLFRATQVHVTDKFRRRPSADTNGRRSTSMEYQQIGAARIEEADIGDGLEMRHVRY
ncbi:MFS general substrate transporter [Hypomontagnella monticulosa]|nr:MFS general substrate transporter [Hypomontagnella monticulosa]